MVERFFSSRQPNSNLSQSDRLLLLSGPPSSGKTSLLFQFALNSALNNHRNGGVVFICNRRQLETKPPYLSQGIDPSSDAFERIQMKYVDDEDGIKKYFSALHLLDELPHTVIIDDFGDMFDERICQERYGNARGRDIAMVRVLALCHNAITHAHGRTGSCKLLISDTHHGDSPRFLFIYKRWIPSIYTIKGDGYGSFLLSNISSGSTSSGRARTAKYSIALQYLVLGGIAEDSYKTMQEFEKITKFLHRFANQITASK